ncbi:UNVERIFIED_CONTAM: hypothetical protein NCL1_17851 [Trichonephila clavipes]
MSQYWFCFDTTINREEISIYDLYRNNQEVTFAILIGSRYFCKTETDSTRLTSLHTPQTSYYSPAPFCKASVKFIT